MWNVGVGMCVGGDGSGVGVDVVVERNVGRNEGFGWSWWWMVWSVEGECEVVGMCVWWEGGVRGGLEWMC